MKISTWMIENGKNGKLVSKNNRDEESAAWLQLIHYSGISRRKKMATLERVNGDIEATIRILQDRCRPTKHVIEAELSWLTAPDHYLLPITDPRYPQKLRQISDPPLALYVKGDLSLLEQAQVAIVGSRRPSPVGSRCAELIATELTQLGLVITSGMALGIDGVAHRSALNVEKGKSVAVLAHGLDIIYPHRHTQLCGQLADFGVLVSEYPLGVGVNKYRFPERNRIVSGLSLGVVIVEAAERSGTLITARLACEQNRELMVVPGSALSAQYRGSHRMIQDGAALVTNAQDVIACLFNELESILKLKKENDLSTVLYADEKVEHPLLSFIGADSTSIDEIVLASGLSAAEVSSELLLMELEGYIAVSNDGGFVNLS